MASKEYDDLIKSLSIGSYEAGPTDPQGELEFISLDDIITKPLFDKKHLENYKNTVSKKSSKPIKIKVYCLACDRELSKELDAYYGRTPLAGEYCSPCRKKKFNE